MNFKKKNNINKIEFLSIKNIYLSKNLINKIVKLKMQHYKFDYKDQLLWYKNNIKNCDIHNLLNHNNKLVGYTCLRLKKIKKNKIVKKILIFDTCVIDKKFRGHGLGRVLMQKNNKVIEKHKIPSFLLCKKKVLNFYRKFKWKKINKKTIIFEDHDTKNSNLMCFNFREKFNLNYKIKMN